MMREARLSVLADQDRFAERRAPLEQPPRERLSNQAHRGRRRTIVRGEAAAFEDPQAEKREVVVRHHVEIHDGAIAERRQRPAADAVRRPRVAAERDADRRGRRRNGAVGAQLRDHLVVELRLLRRRAIPRGRKADRRARDAAGLEAERRALQRHERDEEQRRADEQHDGEHDFADDERLAQPSAAAGGRAARAVLQMLDEIGARRLE